MRKKIKLAAGIIFILFLIAIANLVYFPNSSEFQSYVESIGMWGPALIIFYLVMAHIVAPIAGLPGYIVGYALYGTSVIWIVYIAYAISSSTSFWISRWLGRPWVEKLCGKRAMKQMDDMIERESTFMLIVARVMGFSVFDIVSYASGFTKMSFKKYYLITMTFSLIPLVSVTLLLEYLGLSIERSSMLAFAILVAALIIILLYHKWVTRK